MRPAHLSLIDLRAKIPSTSSGSSWSACARGSSSWSRPLANLPASATASSPIPAGAQQPPTGRIPCPEGLGAHAGFHAARLRPSDPKPAPALLGRAGSHAGRRPARAATLFRVLRPMRCAREQREKLPPEYFYLHARLRFLPCRHARAACDSRDARHATGAGLKSLRSKT